MPGRAELRHERRLVGLLGLFPDEVVERSRVVADEDPPATGAYAVEDDRRRARRRERRPRLEERLELVDRNADEIVAPVVDGETPLLQEATVLGDLAATAEGAA